MISAGAAAVICDGVSSGEESQVASQMAATVFITDYFSTPPTWSTRNAASKVLQGSTAGSIARMRRAMPARTACSPPSRR